MVNSIEDIYLYFTQRHSLGIKPGLERMEALLGKLGNPEAKLKVIHVAGTNGKGSTVQMITDSLIANGYRVGSFTSPSFTGIRGHFIINNVAITEQELISVMNQIIPLVEQLDNDEIYLTEFEIITVLALVYFQERVDIVILEAGMGGRFDTTNCVHPILSVITSVALDHEQFLGDTIKEIAHHKAGIIKQNTTVIVGPVIDEALSVIEEEVSDKQAQMHLYGRDFSVRKEQDYLLWTGSQLARQAFNIGLEGEHQRQNAAIALAVLFYLAKELSFQLNWKEVKAALAKVSLPGRFERINNKPKIIVDSAHNVAGIEAFIATAKQTSRSNEGRLLFAGFRDKNLESMIEKLNKSSFSIALTTFSHERAASKVDFKSCLDSHPGIDFVGDWKGEVSQFLNEKSNNQTLYVTGSLHFVMLVRDYICGLTSQ